MKRTFALITCLVGLSLSSTAAELQQEATTAFDKYVAATEARMNRELRPGGIFLYLDALQADAMKSSYDKLMNGEVLGKSWKPKARDSAPMCLTEWYIIGSGSFLFPG